MYVDECVEGTRRIMESDYGGPLNLGSDESVSIEGLALMVEDIAGLVLVGVVAEVVSSWLRITPGGWFGWRG